MVRGKANQNRHAIIQTVGRITATGAIVPSGDVLAKGISLQNQRRLRPGRPRGARRHSEHRTII
jgi:hypothetical protein